MANQYSADVPKGFNVPKQVRLDSITGVQNELTLKNLGYGNNLAFKYYEGLKIYCKDEKTEYVWREVIGSETGLLTTHFVYPTYSPVDGINYSGKSFNFFLVTNSNAQPPDGSETKLIEGSNITITGTGTILDPYEISSNSEISETYIEEGDNITITGSGIISDPYIVTADLTDSLLIEYSINCGATWINMAKMYKADIANNGNIMQEFDIDGNTTWDGKSFAIPQNAFTSSTFFKFRYRPSDYSNNVYIDNFEINSTPVSIKDINLAGFEVEIVPNPANENASIKVNTKNNATVNVLITNIMGAKVSSFSSKVNTGTINNIEIPKQVFSQKGLYFVTLEIDGKQMTKKLVIQ